MQWIKFLNLWNNWTSMKFKMPPSYYWEFLKGHVYSAHKPDWQPRLLHGVYSFVLALVCLNLGSCKASASAPADVTLVRRPVVMPTMLPLDGLQTSNLESQRWGVFFVKMLRTASSNSVHNLSLGPEQFCW